MACLQHTVESSSSTACLGYVFAPTSYLKDLNEALPQSEELYVTDARALHHIVVKDQYAYELGNKFMV